MRPANVKVLGAFGALLFGAVAALAGNAPQAVLPQGSDAAIAKEVRHEIALYPHYTIFDDIKFQVNQGRVALEGAVTQPYKKSELGKIVAAVPGVTSVVNDLKVLPLSSMDDRLRMQVARAIYRDPSLSTLAFQALPPIHIIVENGHVTLEGVVNNSMQKQIAGMRANSAGLSFGMVTNNLRVENPSPKKG
ncbi:MAG TPA: BON domain-containing protein [Bryobacteraceae bacterium]|nr:BON domain-containing protein [Bryobacteraceae bacterium]